MKLDPQWLREFVDVKVNDHQLADDLTLAGVAVESVRQQDSQTIFEMEITTNRPDAMNHYGVARECSAIYDIALKPIQAKLPQPRPTGNPFPIEIRDEKGCGRYSARVIRNVKIGPSPAWMLDRLKIEDHKGISNAVDASNYTLMEIGQPTHAFDLDKLEGGKIIVRRARSGELLTTLDGVERKLVPEDLIIADAVKPVALAGIMGGLDSAISGSTRNILIECAWFDPATVRKSARYHGMHTDASHIFERGADWGATPLACDRVAELILQTGSGELEGDRVDAIARHVVRHAIYLRSSEIKRILGQDIPESVVLRILRRLGFVPSPVDREILKKFQHINQAAAVTITSIDYKSSWCVELPTWRLDIEREIDLIEEIARVYGYNKFSNSLPSFAGGVIEQPNAAKETKVRSELLALGYNEALSSTFIARSDTQAFSDEVAVPLANPLSEEQSMMRTSLLPGMLGMLAWNLNRGTTDVRLFEIGNIFSAYSEEQAQERKILYLGATGNAAEPSVHGPARAFSFFDLKGDVAALLSTFEMNNLHLDARTSGYFHPGRSARAVVDGKTVAQFGQLHPDVATARKLKPEIYVAEIHLDRLFQLPLRLPRYEPLSRFPAVDRDFSFLFEDAVAFDQIQSTVRALNIAELRSLQPAEIFRGGSITQGKYSVLLRVRFQSTERTLRDEEISQWSSQIIKALESLGGTMRA
ncbi:MAG TPA: phenylalanine--tRNA ligase subunit beta [Candidatus Angelobacter sp.]|jgi:phenylalanyl-tRNA synthetase beta chain|nr:phenylalanine--tRNA ligase subunit beta [Candidatus Angelobacter sp.]